MESAQAFSGLTGVGPAGVGHGGRYHSQAGVSQPGNRLGSCRGSQMKSASAGGGGSRVGPRQVCATRVQLAVAARVLRMSAGRAPWPSKCMGLVIHRRGWWVVSDSVDCHPDSGGAPRAQCRAGQSGVIAVAGGCWPVAMAANASARRWSLGEVSAGHRCSARVLSRVSQAVAAARRRRCWPTRRPPGWVGVMSDVAVAAGPVRDRVRRWGRR